MTRVCLVGDDDVTLHYELLSRETSREALSTYELERPFANSLAVRTVSLGAAISLCNDLQWYIVRFVDEVLVHEPSVSEDEWLSRPLAEALRNGEVDPGETGEFLKIYGLERPSNEAENRPADDAASSGPGDGPGPRDGGPRGPDDDPQRLDAEDPDVEDEGTPDADDEGATPPPAGTLVEPLYVRRTDDGIPEYDLRPVDETVVVRLTEAEYAP